MVNQIKLTFEKIRAVVDEYRFWFWPTTIIMFVIVIVWGPNTSTNWPALPSVIGLVALFFAMHGEEVFDREFFYVDYFLFTTMAMLFVVLYGMVLCLIVVVTVLVVGV